MILGYDKKLVNKMGFVVRDASKRYESFLYFNNNIDDIYVLSTFLNNECKGYLDEVSWSVDNSKSEPDCFDWFFATVTLEKGKAHVQFHLNKDVLTGTWINEQFEYEVLNCFCHETIHLEQYKRVPWSVLKDMKTSYEDVNEDEFWKVYHSDPYEIMAYGHNLYIEITNSSDPEASLRNPENWLEELPTYYTYRKLFKKDTKVIKRLLRYAYEYKEAA